MTERLDLHRALDRYSFQHAVICTYTFDTSFFEGYCLDHLKSLEANPNITVIVDRGTYDGLTAGPLSSWPRLANIRYLLHPIASRCTFHPKVFLFATKDRGLLVVGSANFSQPGLTSNGELVGVFEYVHGKQQEHLHVFSQAMQFLSDLSLRWPGKELASNLHAMAGDAPWLLDGTVGTSSIRLINNLNETLWSQLTADISAPIDELHVVSRFFDAGPAALDRVRDSLAPRRVVFWTENQLTNLTPAWFRHKLLRDGTAIIRDCTITDDDHHQPLHAKAIAIVRKKSVRLAYGSANFTTAALWSTPTTGNVETLVVVDGLTAKECDPCALFDPCGNARVLDEASLVSAPRDDDDHAAASTGLSLEEATLIDRRLECRFALTAAIPGARFRASLSFADGGELSIDLAQHGELLVATLDADTDKLCAASTTVVRVSASTDTTRMESNPILLVGLRTFDTGVSQRRERRIREAQRSAASFAAVLAEILALGETETLMTFLSYCDIRLMDVSLVPTGRARSPWTASEGWRPLGERNLRVYVTLHEAALGFCTRHLRRLERHVGRVSVAQIPSVMHIALAIGDVLRAQVDRALVGLEETRLPIDNEDWADHRGRIDEYLVTFRHVVELLEGQYVPALSKRFKRDVIATAISSDLHPLATLCQAFLDVRRRVDACRSGHLRVRVRHTLVVPPIFPHDLLTGGRWNDYHRDLMRGIALRDSFAAA